MPRMGGKENLCKSVLSVLKTLLAYHHQNSTNACFLVAEAVKAFEALAPAANPTKRLTRSATGSRKWWRSARSVVLNGRNSVLDRIHFMQMRI